jgi:succinyl-CoA synthetase beta subunit
MQVLRAYGIQIPQTRVAAINEDECVRLAEEIGYPVVLKISSPDIVHKVDVGGVELNLKNSQEVRDAFRRIIHNVSRAKSDAIVIGIHIEEFIILFCSLYRYSFASEYFLNRFLFPISLSLLRRSEVQSPITFNFFFAVGRLPK